MAASPVAGKYENAIDRESAFEVLKARHEQAEAPPEPAPETTPSSGGWSLSWPWGNNNATPAPAPRTTTTRATAAAPRAPAQPRASQRQSVTEAFAKSVVRTVGSNIGKQVIRGLLGALIRGR
jgi:uncharacterized protein